ncbi:AlwI family type II restriction endonuclease [Marinifilum fragile]|uniref:AlwI family type II restriction endonuclease n=1 Tax=Marinifilum fragile TaxID=570161 RepID=UPI002AAC2D24|nr:AlwI family type II restriction endonuclease [Marinifilum fragile]
MNKLAFDGYTWNFSQHAIALQPSNLFSLLSAASLFEGKSSFGESINNLLISENVLTSNIRNGKPDAWRDYQQILAETGLIYSTKLERNLKISEAGRLLLSGEIGFSELMSIQALRYQYPNGLKFAFIENQLKTGVLIKPGVLVLRILIELFKNGKNSKLSIDQCQNFLLPITRNQDWDKAYYNVVNLPPDSRVNRHSRRNIQDWFKFLNVTSIFQIEIINRETFISLRRNVLDNLALYESICSFSENPITFWIPDNLDKANYLTWFGHFGHIPTEYFVLLEEELNTEYLEYNYFDSKVDFEDTEVKKGKNINLSEITTDFKPILTDEKEELFEKKINSGYIKRREKTKLHDEIVSQLAIYYKSKGGQVFEDKQSVDLLVKMNNTDTSIFEVKTATLRNIFQRSRLAVGQILEYGYRYNQDYGIVPEKNVVFNVDMENQKWLKEYINNHLSIGLVSVLGKDIKMFPPKAV